MLEFVKNNFSNIIASLALLLSFTQWICGFIRKRENYEVCIDNAQYGQSGKNHYLILSMTILNNSSSNLNITRIYFLQGKSQHLCHLKESWCGERYFPNFPETDIPRTKRILSSQLPLSILANGAESVLIKIRINEKIEINKNDILSLEFVTSKNKKRFNLVVMDSKSDLTYL